MGTSLVFGLICAAAVEKDLTHEEVLEGAEETAQLLRDELAAGGVDFMTVHVGGVTFERSAS